MRRHYVPLLSSLVMLACFLYFIRNPLVAIQNVVRPPLLPPLHIEPFDGQYPYGALVVAGNNLSDLRFTRALKTKWDLYLYNVDDPENDDERLRIPMNKGHESMVYLSWIIDNYETLPWAAVMLHGHADAWHQLDGIVRMVLDIKFEALSDIGYISFQCSWFPSCPAEIRPIDRDSIPWGDSALAKATEQALVGNWRLMFPNEPIPRTIASQCCAQFAVTRAAIRRRPKADYERLRDWLVESLLGDEFSGRVLEKLWAYLFTGNAVHCPPPQQCACEYFGQCFEHDFEQPPEGLPQIPKWP